MARPIHHNSATHKRGLILSLCYQICFTMFNLWRIIIVVFCVFYCYEIYDTDSSTSLKWIVSICRIQFCALSNNWRYWTHLRQSFVRSAWMVNISILYRIREVHHYFRRTSKFIQPNYQIRLDDFYPKVFTDTYMREIVHFDTLYEIIVINSVVK